MTYYNASVSGSIIPSQINFRNFSSSTTLEQIQAANPNLAGSDVQQAAY